MTHLMIELVCGSEICNTFNDWMVCDVSSIFASSVQVCF